MSKIEHTNTSNIEEDESEQSSYALVTSLFSRVKNTFAPPLSFGNSTPSAPAATISNANNADTSRKAASAAVPAPSTSRDRPITFSQPLSKPAPPVVSLTPVVSETPSYILIGSRVIRHCADPFTKGIRPGLKKGDRRKNALRKELAFIADGLVKNMGGEW